MIESTDTTIRKRSLAEEMAVRLQEQIAQGRFEVGGKLPTESELMKIFGVGRSTVREAVKILANMGLLKVQQGAGTFVESRTARNESMERCMQRADIGDLEEVRRILEVAIVERAAQRRTQADIEKIGTHLARRGAAAGGAGGAVHHREKERLRAQGRWDLDAGAARRAKRRHRGRRRGGASGHAGRPGPLEGWRRPAAETL